MTDAPFDTLKIGEDDAIALEADGATPGAVSEGRRSDAMQITLPNENGCLAIGHTEIVARLGRSYAAVEFALCKDGCYRYSLKLMYSYGGFGGPIVADSESFADVQGARNAGMEELLRRWPKPFASDPQSVHEELRLMREQVERQLRQPCLF